MKELFLNVVGEIVGGTKCRCYELIREVDDVTSMGQAVVTGVYKKYYDEREKTMWTGEISRIYECREKCCDEIGSTHYKFGARDMVC